MSEQVSYRYSDIDFISYLMCNGLTYERIEIAKDKQNRLKGFVYFAYDKDLLLNYFNKYRQGEAVANVTDLKSNRKRISMLIKSEIIKYQIKNY